MRQVNIRIWLYILFFSIFILSSCGELGEQTAENIQLVWVNKENHPYLLRVYSVFTCTEFKKTSGSTYKSGYQSYYIDALNPDNGNSIILKEPKKFEFPIRFLQESGRYIWLAVKNEKFTGLNVYNANNMNQEFDSEKVKLLNSEKSFAFQTAYTEFWNEDNDGIVVMGTNGSIYKIKDKSLKATEIPDSTTIKIIQQNYLSHYLKVNDSITISWIGNNKKKIDINNSKNAVSIELLQPQFIMDKRLSSKGNPSMEIHTGDRKQCFSLSKNKLGDEFQWVLSGIGISDSFTVNLKWNLTLDEINNTSNEQKFVSAEILGNRMIVCFKNVVYCINVDNGTIVWKKSNIKP